ncbi:MAG TPA: plastocyanin/azurin family copper-binding protein [Nitrospiria bacterium]|nr:plastocyanin/azurin family copper-binding protein [Nitrospiria bacterium]
MKRSILAVTSFLLFSGLIFSAFPVQGKAGETHTIKVPRNTLKLDPKTLTIKAGDTIEWLNSDSRKHNIASVPGSGPTDKLEIFSVMEPGDTFSHTFSVPGEYPYFCFIHNQMTGHITVTE